MLRAGDEACDLERLGDRPVLRHQFADHHLHGGREQHTDDDGDTADGARGDADRGERAVQQLGEGRFGEHADDQGGDGDAELSAGQLEGQLLQRLHDPVGTGVALGGGLLGVGPFDRDEAELGGDEEAVGEDEQKSGCQEQQGDGHDAAASAWARTGSALCREGAAQVLQDDPSIAGEGHSSDSRNPRAPGGTQGWRRSENVSASQINQDWARNGRGGGPPVSPDNALSRP
ncbi:hypothetical protein GCM10020256_65480 [Streptomyces thermocoprophilus]